MTDKQNEIYLYDYVGEAGDLQSMLVVYINNKRYSTLYNRSSCFSKLYRKLALIKILLFKAKLR